MAGRRATSRTPVVKFIKVGVLGQSAKEVPLERTMTAQQIADQMSINAREVKASKTGTDRLKLVKIKMSDIVNGYKVILFIPAVSGGR